MMSVIVGKLAAVANTRKRLLEDELFFF